MSPSVRSRGFSLVAFWCMLAAVASPAESQPSQHAASTAPDSQAQADVGRLIAALSSDTSSHMRMGPTRTATPADSARAAAFVIAARAALRQYVDVKVAERDGYYRNLPALNAQAIYHYNNLRNSSVSQQGEFDLTKPTSLLYKKDDQGQFRLLGAMYTTGPSAGPEALDAMLPISMAHWHEHVNLCYPRRFPPKVDAGLVFWMKLYFSITSASECASAGGQFMPVEQGWMAHVYLFAGSDDPKMIWDTDDLGNMDAHMRHP